MRYWVFIVRLVMDTSALSNLSTKTPQKDLESSGLRSRARSVILVDERFRASEKVEG